MNKDIELIRKFFSVNYSPLTCNVFYIDGWDTFYILINESNYTVYDPNDFEPHTKFELKDGSFYTEKADNMYTYFDNFLPHISKKIKIQTRRISHNDKGDFEIITEKRSSSVSENLYTFSGCIVL